MAIKFDDYMAKLPKEQQEAIRKRAAELIAEEATSRRSRAAAGQVSHTGGASGAAKEADA